MRVLFLMPDADSTHERDTTVLDLLAQSIADQIWTDLVEKAATPAEPAVADGEKCISMLKNIDPRK